MVLNFMAPYLITTKRVSNKGHDTYSYQGKLHQIEITLFGKSDSESTNKELKEEKSMSI